MYRHGWYHIAFERDLAAECSPVHFGRLSLICVRQTSGIGVFDAICPHRGAHLAYGGRLVDGAIICPFHGYKIRLGDEAAGEFQVRRYESLVVGGMVFVKLSAKPTPDLPGFFHEFAEQHVFVPGFELEARARIEIVMENGFDSLHFKYVHGISNEPDFAVERGSFGELAVGGTFEFPRWNAETRSLVTGKAQYRGSVFSPGVGFGMLQGDDPFNYTVITTAVPSLEPDSCTIRVTLALPRHDGMEPPESAGLQNLLSAMRDGLEKDCAIWNHMSLDSPIRWTPRDRPAQELIRFCEGFRAEGDGPPAQVTDPPA